MLKSLYLPETLITYPKLKLYRSGLLNKDDFNQVFSSIIDLKSEPSRCCRLPVWILDTTDDKDKGSSVPKRNHSAAWRVAPSIQIPNTDFNSK